MIILIDQDGVIADFERGFLENWLSQFPNESFVSLDQRKNFYVREDYPLRLRNNVEGVYYAVGFYQNLPPIAGSIEAIQDMVQMGHDVWICTAPLSRYENCVLEKYLWVEQYLGRDFTQRIIFAKDKTVVRGDILIDDRPHVNGLFVPQWEHVLYDTSYNQLQTDKKRITWNSWRTILNI